nr:BTG12 [Cercospora sp. JNU001]
MFEHRNESRDASEEKQKDDGDELPVTPSDSSSETPERDQEQTEEDDDHVYPSGVQVFIVVGALALTGFLTALDRTILSTAIPKITDEFNALGDTGWFSAAYLLTSCVLILFFGRIYTFYSPKIVFIVSLLIFEIGSAICGASQNSATFIIGRAISGIGSAGVTDGNIVLLQYTVPLRQRPACNAAFGMTFGVASILGPFLGGVFTSNVSWRWCFYINLPIGGAALAAIFFLVKPTPIKSKETSLRRQALLLDPAGTVFSVASLTCLIIAFQWGGTTYAWSDGRIIALLVVFGVLWIAFVLVQVFFQKTSSIPARIIKNRDVLAAIWFAFSHGCGLFTMILYIPMYFQVIKDASAIKSGIMTFPMVIALVIGIISGGILTGQIGYYVPFAYICCVFTSIGCGLIGTWDPDTTHPAWIGYQVLIGLGYGWGFQVGIIAPQAALPREDVATGTALAQFARLLGGTIFTTLGQNLLTTHLASHLPALIPGLTRQQVSDLGATELRTLVSPNELPEALSIYNDGLRLPFYASAGISASMIFATVAFRWLSVKDPERQGGVTEKEKKAREESKQEAA